MQRKTILRDLLTKAYEQENAFLNQLTAEERARDGVPDHWSAKDVIAHNATWKDRMAGNLLAVSQGREPQRAEDYNQENALIFEQHRTKSLDEIQVYASQAFQNLLDQFDLLDEAALESCEIFPWQGSRPLWRLIAGNGFSHPFVHLADNLKERGQIPLAAELIGQLAHAQEALDDSDAWRGVVKYNLACHYSLLGQKEPALGLLREALHLDPSLVEWSKEDSDLEPLREEPGYQAIYEELAEKE